MIRTRELTNFEKNMVKCFTPCEFHGIISCHNRYLWLSYASLRRMTRRQVNVEKEKKYDRSSQENGNYQRLQNPRRGHRFAGSPGCHPDLSDQRSERTPEISQERPSLQKGSFEDGRSEKEPSQLPQE